VRGQPITLARVGGLSAKHHRHPRAPERHGIFAFIWPHIELFLLGSTDARGITDKPVGGKVQKLLKGQPGITVVVDDGNAYVFGPLPALQQAERVLKDVGLETEMEDNLKDVTRIWEVPSDALGFWEGSMLVSRASWHRRPSRYDQLAKGTERLRKFQYTGPLWTLLDEARPFAREIRTGTLQWALVDSGDLVKIARRHLHTLRREMHKMVLEAQVWSLADRPLGASPSTVYSKDQWEVFVPRRGGKIT
jgi:hypothetical protein